MRRGLITLCLLNILAGCGESAPTQNVSGLKIYIFDGYAKALIDEYGTSWTMDDFPLEKSVYTITEDLITDYDWDQQTFSIPNEWGSESLKAPGYMWGGGGLFLVTFNDQRLFSGRVVLAGSPRRFEYPAMALRIDDLFDEQAPDSHGKLMYSFHPSSSVRYEPQGEFLAVDPAVDTAVREHLAALGKLR